MQTVVVSGQKFCISRDYRIIKPIGSGAYGVVVSAENTVTGQKVAIKKIPTAFSDPVDAKRILREIKLMKHFRHENIVSIVDIEPPATLAGFRDIYIVSELMETDLHRVIYSRQKLTPDHVQYFVYQILRALKYMHSANVLHRDLKPSNILLNSNCDLKICDFGLARGVDGTNEALTEYVVTRWYRAPEIMLACKKYTKAVDVWSVGCILGELLRRKALFTGNDYMEQLRLIVETLGPPSEEDLSFVTSPKALAFIREQRGNPAVSFARLFRKADPLALDLLEKMLIFNPAKRITIDEALEHPYMASLHSADDEPVADRVFDFEWEKGKALSEAALQRLVFEEVCDFHPELRPLLASDSKEDDDDEARDLPMGGGSGGGIALAPGAGAERFSRK